MCDTMRTELCMDFNVIKKKYRLIIALCLCFNNKESLTFRSTYKNIYQWNDFISGILIKIILGVQDNQM